MTLSYEIVTGNLSAVMNQSIETFTNQGVPSLPCAPAVTQCDFISLICSVIIESITRSILCTGEQVKYTRTSPNTPLVALLRHP